MQNNKSNDSEDIAAENNFLNRIKNVAIAILAMATLLSVLLLISENNLPITGKTYDLSKIGSWGDAIGGLLNPLFSFLALLGLLWTIRLQNKALSLSRKELELSRVELKGSREANEKLALAADQQNIENAFFQLFNMLQENLQTIRFRIDSITSENRTEVGAKAFEAFHRSIWSNISISISKRPKHHDWPSNPDEDELVGWSEILKIYPDEFSAKKNILILSYRKVYKRNQADLGRYFRLLFNVLRFLSEKKNILPENMYETYFRIVRAALSNYELVLIMVNCLTPEGADMKEYVSEFKLFDNLPHDILKAEVLDEYSSHFDTVDFSSLWIDFDERSFGENINNFKN